MTLQNSRINLKIIKAFGHFGNNQIRLNCNMDSGRVLGVKINDTVNNNVNTNNKIHLTNNNSRQQ